MARDITATSTGGTDWGQAAPGGSDNQTLPAMIIISHVIEGASDLHVLS
jgi:hypothetical protein